MYDLIVKLLSWSMLAGSVVLIVQAPVIAIVFAVIFGLVYWLNPKS